MNYSRTVVEVKPSGERTVLSEETYTGAGAWVAMLRSTARRRPFLFVCYAVALLACVLDATVGHNPAWFIGLPVITAHAASAVARDHGLSSILATR